MGRLSFSFPRISRPFMHVPVFHFSPATDTSASFFLFFSLPPLSRPSVRANTSCTHSGLCVCCSLSKVKYTGITTHLSCKATCFGDFFFSCVSHQHSHNSILFILFQYLHCVTTHFPVQNTSYTCLLPLFYAWIFSWGLSNGFWAWTYPIIVILKWHAACVCTSVENARHCLSPEYCKKRNKQNY